MANSNLQSCFSENYLREFLLSSDRLNAFELEHLQGCPVCQSVLDELTGSDFLDSYRSERSESLHSMPFLAAARHPGDLGSIDDYAIEKQIDQGGMGAVFLGRDQSLGRLVAIKVLLNQHGSQSYARFEAEAKSVAKLSHENIVTVYGVGRTIDNRPYMVMPFIEGTTLRQLLNNGPLNPRTAATYVMQIAAGLEAAHQSGLIHRDIKPANILIDASDGKAKIVDFGLVRDQSTPGLTQADVVCGTPEYMSIEQAANERTLDPRTDVYSLGITLYECLTGTPPFRGLPLEILEQHRSVEPVPPKKLNRAVPNDLETICLKALAKERAKRYSTADSFSQDLRFFLAGRPIQARPFSAFEKAWAWCKRNRALSISTFLLLFSLVAGTAGSIMMWMRSQQNAASARQFASDLQMSRERMRESVQRFQSRIFSNESLHWQMSSTFREDMFRDVINYLDEFATFPIESSTTLDANEDGLASSYLEVANAAFEVGQYEQATLAAQRTNRRVEAISASRTSAGLFLQKCNAFKIILLSSNRLENNSDHDQAEHVESCLNSAISACALSPDDRQVEASRWSAQVAIWEAGYDRDRETEYYRKRVESTRDKLTAMIEPGMSGETYALVNRSLVKVEWLLVPLIGDQEQEIAFAKADDYIKHLREKLRILQKPLLESDRMKGQNEYFRGEWYWGKQNKTEAVEALTRAVISYLEAVERQPQNRIWRMELAAVQTRLADYYADLGNAKQSRDATNSAIINYVHILETDPRDMALRVTVIESLNRFGELSLRMKEYREAYRGFYTAAQDCLLLTGDVELKSFAFTSRVWALVQALRSLEQLPSPTDLVKAEEQMQVWIERISASTAPDDLDWAKRMIETHSLPKWVAPPPTILKLQKRYHLHSLLD